MPARNASASGPLILYLNSGLVSKMPAESRTAKYSALSLSWYRRAARWLDQCSQSRVWFRAAVRSWNGVVRIMPRVPFGLRGRPAEPRRRLPE